MTKLRLFFLALSIFCFATASFANNPVGDVPTATSKSETKAFSKEIAGFIKNIDADAIAGNNETVHVNFIVNNNNEIVVMSTSNENYDGVFKGALNYKAVKAIGIQKFKVFTLPVTMKKS